jgi:hypothetical protein
MRFFAALLLCLCVLTPGELFGQGYIEAFYGLTTIDSPVADLDDEAALGLWAGYAFTSNLAVEAGFGHFGEFDLGDDQSARITSLNVGIKGVAPLAGGLFLTGKVGMAFWEKKFMGTVNAMTVDDKDIYFGFGARYYFNPVDILFNRTSTTYATLDYLTVDVDDLDTSVVSIGIGATF